MYLNKLYNDVVKVYDYYDCREIIKKKILSSYPGRVSSKKEQYASVFMTFDIEATTVKNDGEKTRKKGKYSHFNYCYHWQVCFSGILITGRYIEEYFSLCRWISGITKYKIICFVHNLAYEYNNLADYFIDNSDDHDKDFFFKDTIHPLKITNGMIEYHCSYQITHKSLSTLSDEIGLEKPKEYEYETPRHSESYMRSDEIEYCLRDVYNLYQWLRKEVSRYCESINKPAHVCFLPLTQTGYVRYDIKKNWSNTSRGRLKLREMEMDESEYYLCRQAFRGGDTHANFRYIATTISNARHRDFTSAYPAKMALEKYPMGAWKKIGDTTLDDVIKYIKRGKAVIATYEITNVSLRKNAVGYIAKSKCDYVSDDAVTENGRVMQSPVLLLTISEIDLIIIAETYYFNVNKIMNCMIAKKTFLPDEIIKTVLDYFRQKTVYKGVEGKEDEYALSKQKLNGVYGCCASRLDHPVVCLNPVTLETHVVDGEFENSSVVPYQWAVYITAYVRRDLHEMRQHSIPYYWDTDSEFYKESKEFENFVDVYNRKNVERLHKLAKRLNLDWDTIAPRNPKGERQYLGNFSADDDYIIDKFITVGAKRYVFKKGELTTMVFSGVRSGKPEYIEDSKTWEDGYSVKYIANMYGKGDIFKAMEAFPRNEILIPYVKDKGKLSNYVERGEFKGVIDDGVTKQEVSARASMVLVPVDVTISLEPTLFNLLYSKSSVLENW